MPDLTLTHRRATWHIHLDRAGDDHIVTRLATGVDGRDISGMVVRNTPEWDRVIAMAMRAEAHKVA